MTKFQLLQAFFNRKPITLNNSHFKSIDQNHHFSVINMIEHENGSGHCFNVKGILTDGTEKTLYVETID